MRLRVLGFFIALLGLHAVTGTAVAQEPPEVPACAPGTPHALTFEGLRERIPYGPAETFYVREKLTFDELVMGDVQVDMIVADGETFFSDTVREVEV